MTGVKKLERMTADQKIGAYSMPEPNSGCWIWLGATWNKGGVGSSTERPNVRVGPHKRLASRVSYEVFKGPIPTKLLVLHSCDNSLCVNPDHLRVGTHQDNSDDMTRRGRRVRKGKALSASEIDYIRTNAGKLSVQRISIVIGRVPHVVSYHIRKAA